MLMGSRDGQLHDLRVFAIHSQRYYDLVFIPADEAGELVQTRAPFEEVYESPARGDQIRLHYVMGVVTRVEKLDSGTPD